MFFLARRGSHCRQPASASIEVFLTGSIDLSEFRVGIIDALGLRVGERVEVRSAEEIFATLDKSGCLNSLPFMPEMLQFCEIGRASCRERV